MDLFSEETRNEAVEPSVEPIVTAETNAARVTELEEMLADAEAENRELRTQNEQIERDIEAKGAEIGNLEKEIEELEESIDSDLLEKALELYADPSNWTGHTFTPLMPQMFNDPYDPARAALDGRAD